MNRRHEQFINEYLQCWNATQAYLKVYPKSGYEAARRSASDLLTNPDIAEEIKKRIAENAMKADEVLARLAEQARGDISEFVAVDGDNLKIELNDETGQPKTKTRLIKKVTLHRSVRTIKDSTFEDTTVTLEMYDAQAALQLIGRHHKLFTDKAEIGGEDGGPIPIAVAQPGLLKKLLDDGQSSNS